MNAAYDELTARAQEAFVRGAVDEALQLFGEAERTAAAAHQPDLAERAFCNRCAVLIEIEAVGRSELARLKRILLGATDPKTRWMAAYYSAMAYHVANTHDKAYDYVRRAVELSGAVGEPASTAASANLLGNLELLHSRFEDAEEAYGRALEAYRGLDGYHRLMEAQVRDNLGYVLLCTDRLEGGIELCDQARATMEELGATHYLQQPLQDLCYGHLLVGRLDEALLHGERGLDLARAADDGLVVKNLLFLLAEVHVRRGERLHARRYLTDLTNCYEQLGISEEMVDVLMGTDLTRVVNLRG